MKRQPVRRSVRTRAKQLFSLSMAVVFVMLLGLVALTPVSFTASAADEPIPFSGGAGVSVAYTESTIVTITKSGWYYIEAWGGNGGNGGERQDQQDDVFGENNEVIIPGRYDEDLCLSILPGQAGGIGGVSQRIAGSFYFEAGDTLQVKVGDAGADGKSNIPLGLDEYKWLVLGGAGGKGGTDGTATGLGSGDVGGAGANTSGDTFYVVVDGGAGGGGGGGAASGVLLKLKGTDISNIIIASGGGGGGGGAAYEIAGGDGGRSGEPGKSGGESDGESGGAVPGNEWNTNSTDGYHDSSLPQHDGAIGVTGGGGAGGGGGGWDGKTGGGGQSGSGGAAGERVNNVYVGHSGGGGAGGASTCSEPIKQIPADLSEPDTASVRISGPNGQVNITLIKADTAPGEQKYDVTVEESYAATTGAGTYAEGDEVTINAGTLSGYNFIRWTVNEGGADILGAGSNNATTKFIMPGNNVKVTAIWEEVQTQQYEVTVIGSYATATGAGNYEKDKPVTISAGMRNGYRFTGWTVTEGGAALANSNSNTTTFYMPGNNVTVTANWEREIIDDYTPPVVTPPEVTPPDPTDPVDPQDPTDPTDPIDPTDPAPIDPQPTPPEPTPDPVQPYIPGGTDFYTPPVPMVSNSTLVADEDGGWLELDEDGVPLGKWAWDGDEWVFEDYATPLSNLPMTSIEDNIFFYAAALCLLLASSTYFISRLIRLQRNSISKHSR